MITDEIKKLREIQHLVLIRDEDANLGAGKQGEALAVKMESLLKGLEDESLAIYKRLQQKGRIFLSPLAKGNCSACGMKVPTSILQHVIAKDRFVCCGNCGRLLYVPDVKATGIRADEPDPKFLLSRFSHPKLMVPQLKATTPAGAMEELAAALAKERVIADANAVVVAALEREKILTTAVGHGLAFPHMRGVEEGVLTFACGVSPAGLDWNGELVRLVFFTTLPVVASPFYLKLLAAICKTFEDEEKLPFVLAAGDAKTLWKELNKATRVAVKNM